MMNISTLRQIFENEALTISLELNLSLLRLTWRKHPNSEEYRRGYRQAIVLALENNMKYWLTDSRQVIYLHMADQHWMYTKMRPLLKGGKLLKFAIVLQPETLMMTDQKPILDNPEQKSKPKKLFNMDFFLDISSAQSWLLEESQGFSSL